MTIFVRLRGLLRTAPSIKQIQNAIKRAVKILYRPIVTLVTAIAAAMIAMQSSPVQTFLAERALEALRGGIDGEISVGRLQFSPFKAIVLKDVVITDSHPYAASDILGADTMFRAGYVTARFSLKGLIGTEGIHLSEAGISDAMLYLAIEPQRDSLDASNNLKRIFRLGGHPGGGSSDKEIFSIGRISVERMSFIMKNFRKDRSRFADFGINWFDMEVSDISLSGRDLRMRGGRMSGVCDRLSFREKSGYECGFISGVASVGGGRTEISGFHLKDAHSDIVIPDLLMSYENTHSWSNFTSEVRMSGHISDSRVSFSTLKYFAPTLKDKNLEVSVSGDADGSVSDLRLDGISFRTSTTSAGADGTERRADGISGCLSGTLRGLPDTRGMTADADIRSIDFTAGELENFIKGWAPASGLNLGRWCSGDVLSFGGKVRGHLNSFSVKGRLSEGEGAVITDLSIRHLLDKGKPLKLSGTVDTDRLDIGRVTGIGSLGECDLHSVLSAEVGVGVTGLDIDSLHISRLCALDYEYHNIAAAGVFSDKAFDGRIVCSDPNLNFLFQGIFTLSSTTRNALYRFYANIGYADLYALNIDKRGTSRISLTTQANFTRVSGEDLIGNIDIRDILLEDTHGRHDIGDISIVSHANDDVNRIRLNSKFAEGSYVGGKFLTSFIRDLKTAGAGRSLPTLLQESGTHPSGGSYSLSLGFRDTGDILSFFKPGAYIADGTSISVNLDRDGRLSGTLKSGRLAVKDRYIKDISLHISNPGDSLICDVTAGEIAAAPALIRAGRLSVTAAADSLMAGFSYDNGTDKINRGKISVHGRLDKDADGLPRLRSAIDTSEIVLNSDTWRLHSSDIMIGGKAVKISGLELRSAEESIKVEGGWAAAAADTLHLNLDRFDLSMLNAFFSKDLSVSGKTSGHAMLVSSVSEGTGILLNLTGEDTGFAGHEAGTVRIASVWEDKSGRFNVICRNELDGVRNLDISGYFYPGDRRIEGRLHMNSLNLGYAEPVMSGVFSAFEGALSGDIGISGTLDRPEVSSEGLFLDGAVLGIGYTGVDYMVSGPLGLDSGGLRFDSLEISDMSGGKGTVTGGIGWNHFRNLNFDTGIRFSRMQVIDLDETDNPIFYGEAYASGDLRLTGPLNALMLSAEARTDKDGSLHIPVGGPSSASVSNLLTFKQAETDVKIDPYEELMRKFRSREKKNNEFGIRLDITATPQLEARIEIDRTSGNILSGRGDGNIGLEILPSRKVFNINGSYNITGGNYHFAALGIAKRDFSIQDGSTVRFNGDIMDSDLNINALYKTKASVATLIADTTSTSARRTVECGITISDKLRNPRLDFSINIPDLDPTTQTRVESALNTQDKVQKQLLALLLSGSFIPDEQSGVTNSSSSLLYSNVTEAMAGQLNNILQRLDIPLDFGLDYQQNSVGTDIFDVALSTALFNNRVTVNGTIGNRQFSSSGSASGSEMVGDLDIDVKLDKPGTLRLNLFSHSADQYTNYLDNTQRNGIGLTFRKEFDTVREFIRNLFRSRRRRREEDAAGLQGGADAKMKVMTIEPRRHGAVE